LSIFIPGDQFIDALSRQPDILETAARQGVILASPATLIGLLRAAVI
jgi:DNA anti-recombination protein RmuC